MLQEQRTEADEEFDTVDIGKELERVKWFLWHGNSWRLRPSGPTHQAPGGPARDARRKLTGQRTRRRCRRPGCARGPEGPAHRSGAGSCWWAEAR
jgi:hypothetical protein